MEGSRDVRPLRPECMAETVEGSASGLTLKRTTCSTVGGTAVDIVAAAAARDLTGREKRAVREWSRRRRGGAAGLSLRRIMLVFLLEWLSQECCVLSEL